MQIVAIALLYRSEESSNLAEKAKPQLLKRLRLVAESISALAAEGKMNAKDVARALKEYKIDSEKLNPIGV